MRLPPRAKPGEVNHDLVDRFTFVHATIGALYGVFGLGPTSALLLALAWEAIENPLKARVPAIFPHATRDTFRNAAGDVVAVMCGWGLVRWIATL